MILNDDNNDGVETLYTKYLLFTDQMSENYSAMEIAAVMMAQALSIYKTTMTDKDYNKIVDTISDSRNSVKSFNLGNLQ